MPPRATRASSRATPPSRTPGPPSAARQAARRSGARRYSPVVMRIAAEHDIDLEQVEGTGRGGRVRKQDVLAYMESGGNGAATEPPMHIESPVPARRARRPRASRSRGSAVPSRRRRPRRRQLPRPPPRRPRCRPGTQRPALAHAPVDRPPHEGVAGHRGDLHDDRRGRHDPRREAAPRAASSRGWRTSRGPRSTRCGSSRSSTRRSRARRSRPTRACTSGSRSRSASGGLIVPVIRDAQDLSVEGLAEPDQGHRAARPRERPHPGRGPRRLVHDHQPGRLRLDPRHPGDQPAAGGDPRHRGRRQAARRDHGRAWQRLHRDPLDDVPVHELGPPRARRGARGAIPLEPAKEVGDLADLRGRSDGHPAGRSQGRPAGQTAYHQGMADLLVCHLGRVPYEEGVELQERLRARVQAGELGEMLLLLEHEPVYTLGRRSDAGDLPMGEDWCRAQGIDVVKTPPRRQADLPRPRPARGLPDHARGRRAGVRRRRWSARSSTRSARPACGRGRARPRAATSPASGSSDRKIASIGVHISRGVSAHGFAVNVDQRPRAVHVGRRLRAAVGGDDLARAGGLARRPGRASASAWRTASRRPSAAASG